LDDFGDKNNKDFNALISDIIIVNIRYCINNAIKEESTFIKGDLYFEIEVQNSKSDIKDKIEDILKKNP
jgi:hypothetical protein